MLCARTGPMIIKTFSDDWESLEKENGTPGWRYVYDFAPLHSVSRCGV
jgi:hypothetical protein